MFHAKRSFAVLPIFGQFLVFMIPLRGVKLLLAFSLSAPVYSEWSSIVSDSHPSGWEFLKETYVYHLGNGWRYLPEAETWIYVFDPALFKSAPPGMVLVQGGWLPEVVIGQQTPLGDLSVSSFYIGATEVTWGEWLEVRSWAVENGYDISDAGLGCSDDHPVCGVSWYDSLKWCNAKSEMEGLIPVYNQWPVAGAVYRTGKVTPYLNLPQYDSGYRLPTEKEWEFAARGGLQSEGYIYSGSDVIGTVGWWWENSRGALCDMDTERGTWPVAQKLPNELGIYDMSGNVWEWCWDTVGSSRSIRGGSWSDLLYNFWISLRQFSGPDVVQDFTGFRLARSINE